MESFGCSLPPGFKLPENASDDTDVLEASDKKIKLIGPKLPSNLTPKIRENDVVSSKSDSEILSIIGPTLPLSRSEAEHKDHCEIYGPMPTDSKLDYNIVGIIEKRAAKMKDQLDKKDSPLPETTQREEWMVVPDTSRRNQLGAISRCLAPGSKKAKRETEIRNNKEDENTSKELKKFNKSKRSKSLLEMHQKKKKEKKEKKSNQEERKPFDREEIAVRHFTQKQVNSVIDKAKYLNSRFASSKISKYL